MVTPVFSASYSGLFKTFFDVLEEGTLDGKPVLVAATAGTARHSLVLEHALRPLFSYLHAVVVPTGVFAATEDFGNDSGLQTRIARAAGEVSALLGAAPQPPDDLQDAARSRTSSPTRFRSSCSCNRSAPPDQRLEEQGARGVQTSGAQMPDPHRRTLHPSDLR